MKKRCIRSVERLRYTWRSLVRAVSRKHDRFLVYSMASFNFGGGWRELLSEGFRPKHMTAKSTIVFINESFGI
jgi:hypothetical protein